MQESERERWMSVERMGRERGGKGEERIERGGRSEGIGRETGRREERGRRSERAKGG